MNDRMLSRNKAHRRSILTLLALLSAVLPARAVTYLKADATGSADGSSWANACTTVVQAVTAAAAGDKIIYASGAIYVIPSTIQPADGLSLYGGFPGLSMDETLGDRDVDTQQTIFTGDQTLDDTWIHVEPVFGEYRITETLIPRRVLTNGLVNLPGPFTGDFDGFWPNIVGVNTARGFNILSGVGIVIDGIWFTGFQSGEGPCIQFNSGAKSSSIVNCRFVGNKPNIGTICDRASTVDTFITGCKFLFNRTTQRGSGIASYGRTYARDCEFVSCSRSTANGGNVIFFWSGANINTVNSTFTRCIERSDAEWAETAYGGPGNIVASEGGTGSFFGCVFTNNLSVSQYTYGSPVFAMRNGVMRDCLIANNRYEVKPRAGRSYALFGNAYSPDFHTLVQNCTFTNNTIAAPVIDATAGTYALGILGHGNNSARYSVINCTFADNAAGAAEVMGVTPRLSRGLLSTAAVYGSIPQMGVANCTFSGPVATGVYDVVQYGSYHTRALTVLNSIFTREGVDCEPFHVAVPAQFMVRDCVVKNMYVPPAWLNGGGIEPDEPVLAPLAVLASGSVPVRQVTVRMPGIRETADVATNQPATFPPLFRYRLRGSSTWAPLLPAVSAALDASTPLPMADACGNVRAFGSYTRGAVQPLADAAESGVSLVLRPDPPSGGTFSAPGHAQVVAAGGAIDPVTALPAAGASFLGWFDESGTLYSANATLTIAALDEDTLLTARFDTPSISLTFDLGGHGTFAANGLSTLATNVPAGTAFPAVPAFAAPGWHIEGWQPDLPAFAPWTNAAYAVRAVSTALRIIHVVPPTEVPGGSDGSGSSWANASGSLADAYADAGRHRGEVWLKQGRYLLADPVFLLPNVTVRGGFDGTETAAAQADPAGRPSIVSGDVNGDTYWMPNGVDPGAAYRTNIWSGAVFNRPNPSGGADYWVANGNSADDVNIGFLDPFGGITNAVLDGVVVTGFRQSGVIVGAGSRVALSRCRVYACNTGRNAGNSAVDCGGGLLLEDSELIGNWRAVHFSGSALTVTNIVRNCRFEENSAQHFGAGIRVASTTPTRIEKCLFYRNAGLSEASRCSPSITLSGAGRAWINDCRFEENRVRINCHGNVIFEGNGIFEMARCRFLRNSLVSNSDRTHHSAGIMAMGGLALIRDSSFEANTCIVTQSVAEARAWASVYGGSGGSTTFLNVTFTGNSATAVVIGAGTPFSGTFASVGTSPNLALVHCTADGSLLNAPSREFINSGANNATTLAIVNSVVRNATPGYAPFNVPAAVTLCLADSSITGVDTNTLATGSNGYLYNVTAADARLRPYPIVFGDGIQALGLAAASPFVNAGRPVWLAADGYLYLHDPVGKPATPWRRIVQKGISYGAVTGLSLASTPVPDALGAARLSGDIAYGPLNAAPAWTLFLIR